MSKNDNSTKVALIVLAVCIVFIFMIRGCTKVGSNVIKSFGTSNDTLTILSSNEYEVLEDDIKAYAKKEKINVKFVYKGDLDIVDELNNNSSEYDAVWISNSMWLYMLDNSYLYSESKSLSVSPVVFGITKSKAQELDLIGKDVTNKDILELVSNKKVKYVMNSVTQTNSGATAYLAFVESLAGNPEILTEDMLNNKTLKNNLKNLFSGVERVSGDESYLESMFVNGDYDAVVTSESSLININKTLVSDKKEPLYLIYPKDGVGINDSAFAFIDNGKELKEDFLKLQSYLLSDDGQKLLSKNGYRTWYGGVTTKADKTVFNPDWGIDTTKYLTITKFPTKKVITAALNIYIEALRKPTHVVFCLDYSGSMVGDGIKDLTNAMDYILDYDEASKDKLQFSETDKITVIPFSSKVLATWDSASGKDTAALRLEIKSMSPQGKTALYDAINKGIDILEKESDEYTTTIIAMTDGQVNVGTLESVRNKFNSSKKRTPIYSITFGEASESQLNQLANLSNGKVFNGKTNLLSAFKEVRSYN